jgi:hypothetical protein
MAIITSAPARTGRHAVGVAVEVHGLIDDLLAATPTDGLFWLLAGLASVLPEPGAGHADADRITPGRRAGPE